MPISCHFRDCKALLVTSLTHVISAIASALYVHLTGQGSGSVVKKVRNIRNRLTRAVVV